MNCDISIKASEFFCTIIVEEITSLGEVRKKTTYKNSSLALGRNQFRDVVIKIYTTKSTLEFSAKDVAVFKNFLKEGKSTLHLKDENIKIMIANAPPNCLSAFLKVFTSKNLKQKLNKENITAQNRLLSNVPKSFDEISPLTLKEYESLRNRKASTSIQSRNPNIKLPGASPVSSKRKFDGNEVSKCDNKRKIVKCLNPVILNKEQKSVLIAVQNGKSIFFTGSAGTGKSFLLKWILRVLPPEVTYVTASTGIAACYIGGTTLHSFAGIGSGSADLNECCELANRKSVHAHWKKCKVLIIDEISMVDGNYFTKLEAVARHVKKTEKMFGGIQLIICGDFLQLPPVVKKGEKRVFCFESPVWSNCIDRSIQLTQVKRQDDRKFIDILQNLRMGRCSAEHEKVLQSTVNNQVEKDGIKATRLCTHTDSVGYINELQLKKLKGESRTFTSTDSDPHLSKSLDKSFPVLHKLELKIGAQVMLMKNMDVSKGLVNGARGVVLSFKGKEGIPVVKFTCGTSKEINFEKWVVKNGSGFVLSRHQIPLKLAWAFSIHKSQGMTLDCVEMSLSKVFEAGQAYVALSRAKNLKSLKILDFSSKCITADPQVTKFYKNLES